MVEYVDGILTRAQLQQVLDRRGVDRRAYDLSGSNLGEQYVLDHQGSRWSVFYAERGLRSGEKVFAAEHEACEHLLSLLIADPTTRRSSRSGSDLQLFRFEKLVGERLHTYVSAASSEDVPDAAWPSLWERDYPLEEALNPFRRFGINNGDGEALATWRAFAWNLLDGLERLVIPAYYRDEAAAMLGISRADTMLVNWQYEIDTDEPAFSKADHGFVRGRSCVPIRPEPDDWQRANQDRAGVFPLSSFDDLTRVELAVSGDAASEITLFGLEPARAGDLARMLTADTPPALAHPPQLRPQ